VLAQQQTLLRLGLHLNHLGGGGGGGSSSKDDGGATARALAAAVHRNKLLQSLTLHGRSRALPASPCTGCRSTADDEWESAHGAAPLN
jgi:hypothetical protein